MAKKKYLALQPIEWADYEHTDSEGRPGVIRVNPGEVFEEPPKHANIAELVKYQSAVTDIPGDVVKLAAERRMTRRHITADGLARVLRALQFKLDEPLTLRELDAIADGATIEELRPPNDGG